METEELSTRQLDLEQTEEVIHVCFRRGRDATRQLGECFTKIRDEELYKLRAETFEAYVEEFWDTTLRTAERLMIFAQTLSQLDGAGLELPEHETHARQLARLDENYRAPVWRKILTAAERKDLVLTESMVRLAVDKELEALAASTPPPQKGGVEVNINLDGIAETKKPTANRPVWDEAEELALARIGKICGSDVALALESRTVRMPSRDIILWSELDDASMKSLVHYLIDLRWRFNDALEFERQVDDRSTINDLIMMARAHGGRVSVTHEDARILVEIT